MRSSERAPAPAATTSCDKPVVLTAGLPTVVPRNLKTENHMQTAEPEGQQWIGPTCRSERGHRSHCQERHAHNRNYPDGKCTARRHAHTVQQQPDRGHQPVQSGAVQNKRQKRPGENGGNHRQHKTAESARKQRGSIAQRLTIRKPEPDRECQHRLTHPDGEPGAGALAQVRGEGGKHRRRAHQHSTNAGHGSERPGAFHRVADEAQIVHGLRMQADGIRRRGADWRYSGDNITYPDYRAATENFAIQSSPNPGQGLNQGRFRYFSYRSFCLLSRSTGLPLMKSSRTLVWASSGLPSVTRRSAHLPSSTVPI